MKKIGPRVNETTEQFLKNHFNSLSGGAEYALAAMPSVARKFIGLDTNMKSVFSVDELKLMIDVMNGTILSPQIGGQHLPMNVSDGIALDGLDKKWNVDAETINDKLAGMSTPEIFFLEIWIQGFWQQNTESGVDLDEYISVAL